MRGSTLLGIGLAFVFLYVMLTLEGGKLSDIFFLPPMILIFGGSFAAAFASATLQDFIASAKAAPRALFGAPRKIGGTIDEIHRIADVHRKNGALALENEAREATDPFLAAGLQNIADGMDSESLQQSLEVRLAAKEQQNSVPVKFYADMGGYSPTIGVVATVLSLTHVLSNLSDPESVGPMIASALVATLWGLLAANFMWLPMSHKLNRLSRLEILNMEIVLEGILAIQEGQSARAIRERLTGMVPGLAARAGKKGEDTPGGPRLVRDEAA